MTIQDYIRGEKLRYDINRKAAEISALSSEKIAKYEYLAGEKILLPDQSKMIEQAKLTYSPLGKEKQIKTIEDQGQKQVKGLEEHRKQLVESNALLKRKSLPTDKRKQIFKNLVKSSKAENYTTVLILKI